ncbi:MoaD/ThiS family protein [Salmonella enterica]|uniref:MoaD/ThiS family protein n=2 Tax=Salmonella enterica TaxID=28901 RepID=A0A619I1R6_SALER|nr:MoaD/ThiS family protein [Salmonella enterica]EBV8497074.1 MoaD/ThiS family protein [Salmonella enterica subsp. enterica serovar Java]EBX6375490.1 MoaD/ThiS family protein [Salmonella enterica subsp. enterica serovar Newport]ECJ2363424.1 MoaD/ThiS family protein [Salmonella enterica subsp. diarizonae]EAT8555822.1 MoaD/ThiS family protein [Salmonella enterica]
MSVLVNVPAVLRQLTGGKKKVEVHADNIEGVIEQLEINYPGIKTRLVNEERLHRFINIYINDEDVRFSDELKTVVKPGDEITILPAVAGG